MPTDNRSASELQTEIVVQQGIIAAVKETHLKQPKPPAFWTAVEKLVAAREQLRRIRRGKLEP